jgi:hypothetical protein
VSDYWPEIGGTIADSFFSDLANEAANIDPGAAVDYLEISNGYNYFRSTPGLYNFDSKRPHAIEYILSEISRTEVRVPDLGVHVFRDAYVSSKDCVYLTNGALYSPSGRDQVVPSSIDLLDGPARQARYIEGKCAHIFKAGKDNYGHLLVEMLPRLELLLAAGLRDIPVLIPNMPEPFLDMVEFTLSRVYEGRFSALHVSEDLIQCETLYYPTPVTRHNNRKSWAVTAYAERLSKVVSHQPGYAKKIYLSRRGTKNRPMLNESVIEGIFVSYGFQIVRVEELSFEDQVRVCRAASVIAGPMGAALTSAIFAQKGAQVIVLDPGNHDLFFYDLAALREQHYSWIFPVLLKDERTSGSSEAWIADPDVVWSALKNILS